MGKLERLQETHTSEKIALLAFGILFSYFFLRTTMFLDMIPIMVRRLVTWGSYLLIGYSIVLNRKKYQLREIICFGIIGVLVVIVNYLSDDNMPMIYLLFIIAFLDVEKSRVAKIALWISVVLGGATIIASQIGVIENLVYYQKVGDTVRVRQAIGFVYPTDFAAHIFYTFLMVFYLRNGKIGIVNTVIFLIGAWAAKELCDARLSFLMIIGMVAISWIMTIPVFKRLYHKILDWLLIIAAPVSAVITFVMLFLYEKGTQIGLFLNRLLTQRLKLGVRLYQRFGVTWLGQFFEQDGNGSSTELITDYTFIDMSFQRILMMYGIIFFVVLLVLAVVATKKHLDKKSYVVPVVMAMVAVSAIVDQHFIDFSYNVFLFMLFSKVEFARVDDTKQRTAFKLPWRKGEKTDPAA